MKRRKVLVIAPLFFGYYKDIVEEFRAMGYEADYICDAPSNSNLSKAIGRVNKSLIRQSTEIYFSRSVLPIIKQKTYDLIFLVAGMTFAFSVDMMKCLKKLQKEARYVMYQWDSEVNLPFARSIHPLFDRVYTFDRFDSLYKPGYLFLPLFYNHSYENIGKRSSREEYRYDCSYIGTAHPQKYQRINEMSKALEDIWPNQFIYHYMPSRLKYLYHKMFAREFRNAHFSEFQTEKIPGEIAAKVFEESRCILDAPQAGQRGLTIRSIECLGAKRKLITTNADIKNYDFYKENNILVFDGNIYENSSFFREDYEELPEALYQKYSIKNWLKTIIAE